MGENYFDILGIGRDADDEAVKQAFREMAKACHPDRNPGDASAEQQFKRINTAYEALKDAHRRDAYAEWLHFAETRERSKMAQWGRIGALIAVLIFGPVLLYLALVSTDLVSPGTDSASPPPTPGQNVAAPSSPSATPPQKQAAQPPASSQSAQSQGMHVAPLPVPVTEATKTPRSDAPKNAQPETANRAEHWEPSSEAVPPATTEALPQNQAGGPVPATPEPPKSFGANEEPATPATDVAGGNNGVPPGFEQAPPSGNSIGALAPPVPVQPTSNNFADCERCPQMTLLEGDRRAVAKDGNGRPMTREPVAVSKGEITVSQWNACVLEGPCPRYVTASQNDPSRAVRDVTARDAAVYADWLSRKTGQAYRVLPEAEQGSTQRQAYTDTSCATPGWEWLEEGCPRRAVTHPGFRVIRSLRPTPD